MIKVYNDLNSDFLFEGQIVKIPINDKNKDNLDIQMFHICKSKVNILMENKNELSRSILYKNIDINNKDINNDNNKSSNISIMMKKSDSENISKDILINLHTQVNSNYQYCYKVELTHSFGDVPGIL